MACIAYIFTKPKLFDDGAMHLTKEGIYILWTAFYSWFCLFSVQRGLVHDIGLSMYLHCLMYGKDTDEMFTLPLLFWVQILQYFQVWCQMGLKLVPSYNKKTLKKQRRARRHLSIDCKKSKSRPCTGDSKWQTTWEYECSFFSSKKFITKSNWQENSMGFSHLSAVEIVTKPCYKF